MRRGLDSSSHEVRFSSRKDKGILDRYPSPCFACVDGWVPGETGIERCDECARFASDEDAQMYAAEVRRLIG